MKETLSTISSYSGLLPMVVGVFFWSHRAFRPFLFFLLIGILNDLLLTHTPNDKLANFCMSLYSLFDILFLLWFTSRIYSIPVKWKICIALTIFALWFGTYNMFEPWHANYSLNSRYFDPFFLTVVALLAAYGLIKIIESPKRSEWQGYFGFFIGIFIYNFCIFFNHTFVTEEIAKHFWYLNASFNILTMLIYTWAFIRLRKMQ